MNPDDERPDLRDRDPAKLLPFTHEIGTPEPLTEKVERLPKAYVGTDQKTYGGTTIY